MAELATVKYDYVALMDARTLTEAGFFRGLLVSRRIPAIIRDGAGEATGTPCSFFGDGVPVLVPDQLLEEAKRAIHSLGREQPKNERPRNTLE